MSKTILPLLATTVLCVGGCAAQEPPKPTATVTVTAGSIASSPQPSAPNSGSPTASVMPRTTTGIEAAPARDLPTPATFKFEYQGVEGRLEIAVDTKDPRLQTYGDYRRLAGATPVTYLAATINNASQNIAVNMYSVQVITPSGEQLQFKPVSGQLEEWLKTFSSSGPTRTRLTIGKGLTL